MGHVFYVLAIMGCGDSGQACQQARVEPVHYITPAACQAALPDALQRNTDLSYPVLQASCMASGPTIAQNGGDRTTRG